MADFATHKLTVIIEAKDSYGECHDETGRLPEDAREVASAISDAVEDITRGNLLLPWMVRSVTSAEAAS